MELDILWLDMVFWMSVERTSNGKSKNKGNGIVEPSGCTSAFGRVEAAARQVFDARAKEGDEKVWSQPSKEDPGLKPCAPTEEQKQWLFQHSLKPGPTSTGKGNNEGKNQATAKAQCGGLSTAAAKALPPVEMTSLSFGFEEKQQK
jgi:hypothetical protein